MEIKLNSRNEIEYRYSADFPDELVDIASDALDIMRENHMDTSKCVFALMNELDLTIGEAKEMVACPTEDFEKFIYDLFTLTEE